MRERRKEEEEKVRRGEDKKRRKKEETDQCWSFQLLLKEAACQGLQDPAEGCVGLHKKVLKKKRYSRILARILCK